MRIIIPTKRVTRVLLAACVLALAGCTNDDYDFNEIDSTIGIGCGELTLPGCSTDTIQLADVLDLDDTECVEIDPVTSDYVFRQDGGEVESARPFIEQIEVTSDTHEAYEVRFTIPSQAKAGGLQRLKLSQEATADGRLHVFSYSGDKPDAVIELLSATTSANFVLTINFSDAMKRLVPRVKRMSIDFPAYMELSDMNVSCAYTMTRSTLQFENVGTTESVVIRGKVRTLDFTAADKSLGELKLDNDKVLLDGNINVAAAFDEINGDYSDSDLNNIYIGSTMDLQDFVITEVTGRFSPEISLNNLGDVEISDVPDFLTEGNVVVDLYNPQILLTLNNNMDMEGSVSGTLTAYKNGAVVSNEGRAAMVEIGDLPIKANGETRICICRNATAVDVSEYDVVRQVDNLSELIRTIPDKITFSANAQADDSKVCRFVLGHEYEVSPSYKIQAPLAFAEDAKIVYTDEFDEWNDDVKDFDLSDGSYIQLTAEVENRVPLNLSLTAEAIDVNGNVMDRGKVAVEVDNTIIASADGVESVRTPILIKLTQGQKGALKELDGLKLTFEGDATAPNGSAVVGVTLNSRKHFIIAHDIEIKLSGQLIANFD